jgi:hypothetical protein
MNSFFFFSTPLLLSSFVCDGDDVKLFFFMSLSKQLMRWWFYGTKRKIECRVVVRVNAPVLNTNSHAWFWRERKVLVSSSCLLICFSFPSSFLSSVFALSLRHSPTCKFRV